MRLCLIDLVRVGNLFYFNSVYSYSCCWIILINSISILGWYSQWSLIFATSVGVWVIGFWMEISIMWYLHHKVCIDLETLSFICHVRPNLKIKSPLMIIFLWWILLLCDFSCTLLPDSIWKLILYWLDIVNNFEISFRWLPN